MAQTRPTASQVSEIVMMSIILELPNSGLRQIMRILLRKKIPFFPIWPFLGPFQLQGLFSWEGAMHVITLWGSGGESVLRFSLVALQTRYVKVWSVSFAEEAIVNIIKSSYMIYCRFGFTS